MKSLCRRVAITLLCLISNSAVFGDDDAKVAADHAEQMKRGLKLFTEHVRPLFAKHCLDCHGGKEIKAEFNMATRDALMESGLVEDDADSSHFFDLLTHDEEPHMPHKADKLPADAIKHIADWINLGSPYDKPLAENSPSKKPTDKITEVERNFWSLRPLTIVAPPAVQDQDWVRTPVDRFVLKELETRSIKPNSVAARRTLIRRAYFGLLGLPPTPEQVDRFVADKDPHAYEKMVDDLLGSEHHGERWARHWMDVARFAESFGYEQDYDRPHAYHYRDFLIKAINQDMPYDQFMTWQIAGDEVAPDETLAMMATGFMGGGAFPTQLTEAEFESSRYEELDDMVRTTIQSFLGLTIGCSRCHSHKFDPIPMKDYYRLASAFTTTIRCEVELQVPGNEKKTKVQVTSEGFPHMKHHADGRGFPHFYKQTFFLERGDVNQKKEAVAPGFLQVLMRDGHDESHWRVEPPKGWTRTSFHRASLANWLTDTEHGAGHLAARVIVNRIWQHHFGRGLVSTPNDFGFQGARPTHPKLLDWLATDLIHHGWRLKRLHKLILTSAVYMQSSASDEARSKLDLENIYLWRRTPRRLEGEAIRDAMLSVSGLLDETMYGPGSLNESMRRRSVYFFIKRSKLIPTMMLFDWPEHLVSIGRRSNTTIAPQTLLMMNNAQTRLYADGVAKRVADKSPGKTIANAYQLLFGRDPSEGEWAGASGFVQQQTASYRESKKAPAESLALSDLCQALMSSNEFVFVE
jgi:mono/diheme cytochrome c family protein